MKPCPNKILIVPKYYYPTVGGLQNFSYRILRALVDYVHVDAYVLRRQPRENVVVPTDSNFDFGHSVEIGGGHSGYWENVGKYVSGNQNQTTVLLVGIEDEAQITSQMRIVRELSSSGCEVILRAATTGDVQARLGPFREALSTQLACLIAPNLEVVREAQIVLGAGVRTKFLPNPIPSRMDDCPTASELNSFRADLGIKSGEVVGIWTGRFTTRKRLLHTVNSLLQIGLPDHVLLLGYDESIDQSQEHALRKLAATSKRPKIHVISNPSQSALHLGYTIADFYISLSSLEGMSNSVLEAISYGMDAILSDIPGHRECEILAKPGKIALVDPEDIMALRRAVVSRCQGPRPYQQDGSSESSWSAYEYVKQLFLYTQG